LKTALVKQAYDVFGPWSGVLWKDTSPTKLFEIWPGKAVYWELTCMLQADWYIIPQAVETDYTRDSVAMHPGRADLITKYTSNITLPANIPLNQYDLVISFDAALPVPANASAVFAYFAQEHWDRLYQQSLNRLVYGYDLFLAHMMDSRSSIQALPQAVSFPYTHDLTVARSMFPGEKQNQVWVDWRTLMTLSMKNFADPWSPEEEKTVARLQETIGVPIAQRGMHHSQSYGVCDPPAWGDAQIYLSSLASCKYYVGVGQIAGAGQGLAEAAALGCICVGQQDKAYHRLVCHPSCLCEDLVEMPSRLKKIAASDTLQREALAWQDSSLREHFERKPLEILQQAIRLKANRRG
jgi:hypothetical protein